VREPQFLGDSHRDVEGLLSESAGRHIEVAALQRMDFYEAAGSAFAMVHTSDNRPSAAF
jgi:L-fucose mutarotase/ribose pyranase (RbsD/FucU family)